MKKDLLSSKDIDQKLPRLFSYKCTDYDLKIKFLTNNVEPSCVYPEHKERKEKTASLTETLTSSTVCSSYGC